MQNKQPVRLKRDPENEKKDKDKTSRQIRFGISYLITTLLALWLFQQFILRPAIVRSIEIPYSEFKQKLAAGQIVKATIDDNNILGEMKNPKPKDSPAVVPFDTIAKPSSDPNLVKELQDAGVSYTFQRPPNPVGSFLLSWFLPIALLGGFYFMAYRRMGGAAGGMGGIFGVGKSKATEVKPEDVGVTFKDVGGADEAIAELQEIIQFLSAPEQFAKLGGRIPKGVLLVGPPGTGKTLLAKATAGEAQVAFFETSGSEFVEMFVGVGAARVRDLFEQARKAAPAIVFIDEIDGIGESRAGAVRLGGNDEREQTLNQLLAEIDGFKTSTAAPVIIMAATNRPEVLDPALLRAGRFDRQVAVGNPDVIGRLQILKIHSKGIKLSADFDMERAARITPGFSGADLANVMNEAALLAARRKAEAVTLDDFQVAIERVVAGLEKKSRVMNEQERTTVAYHESGHALVAELVPHGDPVSKISIIPHSRGALGYTMQMPTEDRYLLTMDELQDRIAVMLGGRAAEMIVFNTISTGASDDIQRATELARRMVTEFGMSEKLGSVRYAGQQLQYLGGVTGDDSQISPETRQVIDGEVQRIATEQYERAQVFLKEHRAALETLAQQLLKQETVDGAAVKQALGQGIG
jgi:cell division protease FtsH